jgi:hypothetical protein
VNLPKLLTSPLAATAGVLVGLSLLAVPLRQITSATPVSAPLAAEASSTSSVPSWLTLKLLAPAKSVTVTAADGQVIWKLGETPAGDLETQATLPLDHGGVDLTVDLEFGGGTAETAAFLTIAPDGLEEQTRHTIGSGRIEEMLRFTWQVY